jgi:hypothetical protein
MNAEIHTQRVSFRGRLCDRGTSQMVSGYTNTREILRSEPDWRICAAQDDEAKVTQCGHRRCAVILVSDLPGDDAPRITFAPSLQPQTRIPSRCHVVAHAGVRPRRVVRLHPNTNRFVVDGRQGRYHTLTIHHSRFPR